MNFYCLDAKPGTPPKGATFPCVAMVKNSWDDYGYKTLFAAYLWKDKVTQPLSLGDVKVLEDGMLSTTLPDVFTTLGKEFVSLGQDADYYGNVKKFLGKRANDFLDALNDLVEKPQLLEAVETQSAYRNSLVRFNDAKIALRDGRAILAGRKKQGKPFSFTYRASIPGAELPIEVTFDLDSDDPVPGRVAAVIGRNGAGKTQLLAQLARDLADTKRISKERLESIDEQFSPERPLFSRVIALSFSAFDRFSQPQPEEYFSYIYCGVRTDGRVSSTVLDAKLKSFLGRIKEQGREEELAMYTSEVLGIDSDQVVLDDWLAALESDERPPMSSGQSILVYFVAASLAFAKENALILFDEPETHLHPNAVASLMGTLQRLLKKYDAYAIVATHSPLVIQEVPGKRVTLIEREGAVSRARALDTECFGESISELTRYVFETVEISNFYKTTFKNLLKTRTSAQVAELFDGALSLHASAYLASQEKPKVS